MKKLSDYRIKEENGEITIEKETDIYVLGFKKREKKFVPTDFKGKCCLDMDFSNKVGKYPSVEAAKAQIIKWCEEQKYHYVREFEGYFYKEQISLSRSNIEYIEKCMAEREQLLKTLFEDGFCIYSNGDIKPNHIDKTEQQLKEQIIEKERIKNAIYIADLDNILFVMTSKDNFIKSLGLTKEELFDELKQKYGAEKKTKK